ncbi:MAG: hypothetical protein WCG26_02835, partial [Chloroflexales bacterium]
MSIPDSALRGPVKHWTATLTLGGTAVDVAGELPRRSVGFSQPRGTCTLATLTFPDVPTGTAAVVTLTLNGTDSVVFFTGQVGARPISDLPLSYELGLVDSLSRLSVPLGEKVTWRDITFPSAVRDLLHRGGVTDGEIARIFNPGSDYQVAPIDPVELTADTTVQAALDDLLKYGGCALFVGPDGRLEVTDAPGWPGEPVILTPTYAYGATTSEFGFYSARRTIVGAESVVAKFTAKGPKRKDKQIPDATFTITGASGTSVEETYAHLQTDECAKKIAEREIIRRNRAATEVDVSAPLNPNLRPGDTINFRHAELGIPTTSAALIIGISSNGDEMSMQISVGGAPPTGTITLFPSPSAAFTTRFEVQPIKLAGVMATHTLVECVDAVTDPSGFRITNRDWKAACSGTTKPEPETVSWSYDEKKTDTENPVPNPVFVFPTLDGATVTLVVESASGEGNTSVQSIVAPSASAVFTRTISVAAGVMGWRVLAGDAGWRGWIGTADCTAVPTINDQGPLLAGFANGEIRKTEDNLATEPPLLATLPATVHCFWVNEGNPLLLLAGAGQGLHRSTDGGASWTAVHTFPDTIEYCENSPSNPNEIRVCAGAELFRSYDGATFGPSLSGVTGTLCRKVASAPWGHLMVFSGGTDIANAWAFEETGITIDWTQVPTENMPLDLAAATPLQFEEGYLVADGGAADLIRDGLFSQLGYLANQGITNIYKLTRAGTGFVATYCATAEAGGPHKVIMAGGKAFPIDESDALRIGYGQATDPARPPQLLVLPSGASGAADRLAWYIAETGWQYCDLPVAGQTWLGMDICPGNPHAWLIWTSGAAFFTGNSGQTWAQIWYPTEKSGSWWGSIWGIAIQTLAFTGTGMRWIMSLQYHAGWGAGDGWYQGYLAAGDGPMTRISATTGSQIVVPAPVGPYLLVTRLVRGYSGELWGAASGGRQVQIDPTTLTITDVGETPYTAQTTAGAARAGYGVWNTNIARTPNYRTTVP